ncbi:MAG: dihydroorotase family protein, partial [Desulfurococcales archaeon]|nr:dihydroorotase family protein [Desulfurococcales archaeon]
GGKVLIVHIAAKEGVELVKEAKFHGLNVYGETCPHYLLLNTDDYAKYGTAIKVNPPIRSKEHQEALWRGVLDGTITNLGSDHAPHSAKEKEGNIWECSAGFTGVQTFLPLMLDQALKGRMPINKIPELMSENPAKLFNIWPKKGAIIVGSDGDFAIVDPNGETVIERDWIIAKYPITPYIGWRLKGRVKYTILRGMVIAKDGKLVQERKGEFFKPVR